MNFRRGKRREPLELNLIPLIDVLLVILIFLLVTTTFSQIAQLQIDLPKSSADKSAQSPFEITVAVNAAGQYRVNNVVSAGGVEALADSLRQAAGRETEPIIVINADAQSPHQSVINVMEAARLAGYTRINFATQTGS